MKPVRFAVEAAAFRVLMVAARALPRGALLGLGALGGALGYALDARHRRIAVENLRRAFGDGMDETRARRLTLDCWRHFGRITLDTLAFPRLGPDSVERLATVEGLDHLRAAHERGRGVLVFTGHYGHWELAGLVQGHLGFPLSVVARPLDNPRLERLLVRLRGGSGNRVIHKRHAVREIMKTLRDGRSVAIVIDQDARRDGVFVPFFGRLASTTPTLALLALRTGAPVIPCSCTPEPDGKYRIVYEPPVEPPSTGDRDEDVLRLTARCTAIIEGWVRRRPELWLWMHRRWKTRPPQEPAASAPAGPSRPTGGEA
jgi:KDO2-lipid IV(A) lauroyltransferase